MCGIAGFVGWKSSRSEALQLLERMKSVLHHRGPDSNGTWCPKNQQVYIAHTRLSIIDLSSKGSQPMQSSCKRFTLSFNGEIYNHLEIRKFINSRHIVTKWKSSSDTETLVESFARLGIYKTLDLIKGMFSIALFDGKTRRLYLIRDRFGEKPLHYLDSKTGFVAFASELAVFKKISSFDTKINVEAINGFFRRGYIRAPHSVWENVRKVMPGCVVTFKEKNNQYFKEKEESFWSVREKALIGQENIFRGSYSDGKIELEKILTKAVKSQTISDVSLGVFLSGGIDSSLVAAVTQKVSMDKVKTFSIGFNEAAYDESKYAEAVSKHLGTSHETLYATPKDALEIVEKIPIIYSEPFADSSQIPTILLSALVKNHVTVALSGDGGDELFSGYTRYIFGNNIFNKIRLCPFLLRKFVSVLLKRTPPYFFDTVASYLGQGSMSQKAFKLSEVLLCENFEAYYDLLTEYWPQGTIVNSSSEIRPVFESLLGNVENMMLIDQVTYLPDDILVKVDRAAMSQSLETRAPLLDHSLAEFAWTLPSNWKLRNNKGKVILQDILGKYIPKKLIDRPKQGFGVPIGEWIKGPLKDWAKDLCDKNNLPDDGVVNGKLVRNTLDQHLSGKYNWEYRLWPVLIWQQWIRAH